MNVPIPPFDADGDLPPGEHTASWAEVVARCGTNPWRTRLLAGLRDGLLQLKAAGCREAFLDGSFSTDKDMPGDFDVCYEPAGVDPRVLDPVFFDFTNQRAGQKGRFGGEFFPASVHAQPRPPLTYRRFFQQRRGKSVGIIRLDLTRFS